MKQIAIFYHCLFFKEGANESLPAAPVIVLEQMNAIRDTGLLDAASLFTVGVNGGDESNDFVRQYIPSKAKVVMHGLHPKNENLTIVEIEKWLPLHEDWNVLYFHSKGATHKIGDGFTGLWRQCMMRHNIFNWKQCVKDLDDGYDAVGCHWMTYPATPKGQSIFAGTFWWAKASYLLTLPSILDRNRIKVSGIENVDSRYESEVWIGNGPLAPKVKDYHGPDWNPSKINTCA